MKWDLFWTWVAMSAGSFSYQAFNSEHVWRTAAEHSFFMGIAFAMAAYRLRGYQR